MSDNNKQVRTLEGRVTKLHAQNDLGANEGDVVRIAECRPLSKTKHHRVVEIVTRAEG
jgi:small subunit ribosomal protein S17